MNETETSKHKKQKNSKIDIGGLEARQGKDANLNKKMRAKRFRYEK